MSSSLETLTNAITAAVAELPAPDTLEEAARMKLLSAIDELRAAIEPPMMSIRKLCFSAHAITAVQLAQGMGIFDAFMFSGGAELTLEQLDEVTKGDRQLLLRILRILSCEKIVQEMDHDTFRPKPLAVMLASGSPPGEVIKHFYAHMQISAKLYHHFERTGYSNPDNAFDGPFQTGLSTKKHYFDWLKDNPEDQRAFNTVMTMARRLRGEEWFEFFPVENRLHTSPDRVALVDIGGGIGYDVRQLSNKFPQLPGELVVQDLPQVIDDIREALPTGVTAMKYDMFTEQPIKGAKAYYMCTVLHDWPDPQALVALKRIHDAMDKDSILLLNENTLPDANVTPYSAHLDFTMMEVFASLERTEKQWVDLLAEAGFKVQQVWKPTTQSVGSNALFEVVLE